MLLETLLPVIMVRSLSDLFSSNAFLVNVETCLGSDTVYRKGDIHLDHSVELGRAKRQRKIDTPETRCRGALLQVCWERVAEMGRWAVGAMQRMLNKTIPRQHQWNWDRGWLQFRAQEEAAKLWVRERIQAQGIDCWHLRGLDHNAQQVVHAAVQQECAHIVELEMPVRVTSQTMGSLLGEERASRGAIQERAMLVLMMEAAAARRKLGQRPTRSCWEEGNPLGQEGWRNEDPPEDAGLRTPLLMGPQTPAPRGTQPPAENLPQQPDLARDLLDCSTDGLKRRRSPQNNEQIEPELRLGLYGIRYGRERGWRPRIGISEVRTVSDHP